MKKTLILLLLFFTVKNYSQSVTINTTTYSADQLVNQVLINSPCVSGTNVNSKTGSSFGSSNSIGYFENINPNFPFKNGVVLTSGDVNKVPGPNTTILSDGNAAWTGDADLEANLLSQSGITINSINASFIEFDFKPKTPNFDFSFLFASEEYGTSQCNFSDAFAFLLKDVTTGGPNINLAVIPNTNTPISVQTIRNSTYNSNCPSANPSFFGSFNGGGFGPAINFNGQTIPMLASASGLDITHTYRIKLVIADGSNNTGYDSAIFLNANTFNIGQDILGLDYTLANNKAICPGSPLPILSANGLSPSTTFTWKLEGVDFSPAQTGQTLDLNSILPLISSGIHNYSVSYTEPGCIEVTDEISVGIYPALGVISSVPNIYACDTGAANYDFDLTKNTSIIRAGNNQATTPAGILDDLPAGTTITYHLSNADAVGDIAAISSPHTITSSANGKIIYVRIENSILPCYEIRSFQLQIVPSPKISSIPNDITLCARNTTDFPPQANFDLTTPKNSILGLQNQTYNILSFHSTLNGANTNTDIITPNASNILITSNSTLWVRLQNISNPACYVTTSFKLIVTPIPEVDILNDVVVCSSYILPVLTKTGAQYWTGSNGTGTQLFAGNNITTPSTIYVFNQSGSCSNQDSFTVTISDLNAISPTSGSYCSEYRLPALAYAKYFKQSGGTNTIGNTQLAAGSVINTAGLNTIYVWFEDTTVTPSCTQEKSFTATIIPFTLLPEYVNQFGCNSYTLPVDPNGGIYYSGPNKGLPIIPPGTIITVTTPIYVFKETATTPTNCFSEKTFTVFIGINSVTPPIDVNSCSAYILPQLIVGEYRTAASGGGLLVTAGTSINATTTLWYYVPGQNCTDNLQFTITVNIPPLPFIPDTAPQCDVYFLPTVAHTGNYFTGPLGTGIMLTVGLPITSTQKVYFYDKAATGPCYVEEEFLVIVNSSPLIDARPVEVIQCGQGYILDDLINGEYYQFPGGPSPTNPILPPGTIISNSKTIYVYALAAAPNTCFSEYSISVLVTLVNPIPDQYACNSYSLPTIVGLGDYYTNTGGPHGSGVKLIPPYSPINTTTTVYVYAEDNTRNTCSDEDDFIVTIYKSPVINPIAPITRCESYALPPLVVPINRYFTKSGGPGNSNTEKFPGDLITSSTTIYAYAEVGSTATVICTDEKPMVITIISKPKPILTVPAICHDFETGAITDSHIISGFSAPRYSFEWKKEDGTLVGSSSDFSTNQPGNYTLIVTDLSIFGCPSEPIPFTVIESAPPASISFTTEGWFSDNQTITVNAVPSLGDGTNFLYSLDGNSPQKSNIFTNVSSGVHEISVSDANGCGSTIPILAKLVFAPKYFTPNGDGYNDTWNVTELPNQDNPKLFIFDRYGKFLIQLFPNGPGWDGTFNGYALPADDYWFSISYSENEVLKEYRSHFSLKR
ncbi:gliding motility-associated-like protein [Flavobacterium sp. CG_23.5]|uniref:T9SS type B sorting domain-containing protein n=1 Tax=Flavobacterium sp. CG_23.5 TaxID=2760708 RepID=UPI001AE87FAB|nr:T9SS type B sorting domain-containing protein [Flavobacterium sp. CG_23.5]MBP2282957.1 gliding motility-associated-like protein [Flavobacterium sp. CG_23.5]